MKTMPSERRADPTLRARALDRGRAKRSPMSFRQTCVLRVLLGLTAATVPLSGANAEQDGCIPRDWAISIVDPNVLDADSYGADTSIFLDATGRARVFYAKGPVNIDGWRIKSAVQRSDTW